MHVSVTAVVAFPQFGIVPSGTRARVGRVSAQHGVTLHLMLSQDLWRFQVSGKMDKLQSLRSGQPVQELSLTRLPMRFLGKQTIERAFVLQ